MFRVVLADGSIRELPRVADATVEKNALICYDEKGAIVERYEPREVIAFGRDGAIANLAQSGATAGRD
jgi:hypothetical protein